MVRFESHGEILPVADTIVNVGVQVGSTHENVTREGGRVDGARHRFIHGAVPVLTNSHLFIY